MESHLKFPRDPAALSTVSAILKEVRVSDVPPPRLAMKPPLLPLVIFSDFELDDLMAIAELWQWRAVHMGAPEDARPIIVFITDFKTKDGGEVFEKKLLMARMLLGVTLQDIYTLVCPPGTGNVNWTYFDKKVHPAAPQLYRRKDEILAAAAQDIVDVALSDSNEVVDVYFISPGRGLFGELLQGIERDHPKGWEALCQKANVVMYTGSFNTQGCTLRKEEAAPGPFDYDYIGKLCTVRPLVDISKFVFFGREKGHPVTASADSFASPTLAQSLAERSDLLAACIHAFVDEFQGNLVKPANLSLFRGSELSQEEWDHFKEDIAPLAEVDMQQYAAKLANDALFQKVPNYKKTTEIFSSVRALDGKLEAADLEQLCGLVPLAPKERVMASGSLAFRSDMTLQAFLEHIYGTPTILGWWPSLMEEAASDAVQSGLPLADVCSAFELAAKRGHVEIQDLHDVLLPALGLPTEGSVAEEKFAELHGSAPLPFRAFTKWLADFYIRLTQATNEEG